MIFLLYPIKTYIAAIKNRYGENLSARLIDWNGEIFDHLESNSKEFDQYLSWWSYKKFKENIHWKNSLKKHKNFIRNNFIRNKCLNNFFKKIDVNEGQERKRERERVTSTGIMRQRWRLMKWRDKLAISPNLHPLSTF